MIIFIEFHIDNRRRGGCLRVFIDGDSFAKPAREVVIRAAIKRRICAHFVANHPLSLPKRQNNIFFYQVSSEKDAADDFIVQHTQEKDLVLTRDIILADRLLNKNIWVINDRGYRFNANEIRVKLHERVIMLKARESGLYVSSKDNTYTKKDLENFSNCLYNIINRLNKHLLGFSECVMIAL